MARSQVPEKRNANLRAEQMRGALPRLRKRVEELKAVQVDKITTFRDPDLQSLQQKVTLTLGDVFGSDTVEFGKFGHVNLFPYGRIFLDGGPSIPEIQQTYRNGIAATVANIEAIISHFEEKLSVEDARSPACVEEQFTGPNLHPEAARVTAHPGPSTNRPGFPNAPQVERELSPSSPDPKKVFIIHGRNVEAATQMGIFLRTLGLLPITFGELRARVGGTATIDAIVEKGMFEAQGVIAIFTPDEYAALQPKYRHAQDRPEEITRWQARPNVLFEAGMACGRDRNRVVFVLFGNPALFTDVAGVHVLRPNNNPSGDRAILRNLLAQGMKCTIDAYTNAWMTAGDFERCVPSLPALAAQDPFILSIEPTADANQRAAQTHLSPAAQEELEKIRQVCLEAGHKEYESINWILDSEAEVRVYRELARHGYVEQREGERNWKLTERGVDEILPGAFAKGRAEDLRCRIVGALTELAASDPTGQVQGTFIGLAEKMGENWDAVYEAILALKGEGLLHVQIPGGYGPDSSFVAQLPTRSR